LKLNAESWQGQTESCVATSANGKRCEALFGKKNFPQHAKLHKIGIHLKS
jgi:hypothetical protein